MQIHVRFCCCIIQANTRHISAVATKYQLNITIITACAQTTSAKKWWNEKIWPNAEHHAQRNLLEHAVLMITEGFIANVDKEQADQNI